MTATDNPALSTTTVSTPRRGTALRRPSASVYRWLSKLGSAVFVLWAAATITFFLQVLAPGDRATLLLNLSSGQSRERTADELAPVNAHYGFDDSIWQQYVHYLTGLLRGDLGTSYQLQQPVTEIIADQIAPTLILTISALIVAWLIVLVLTTLRILGHGRVIHRNRQRRPAAVLARFHPVGGLRHQPGVVPGGERHRVVGPRVAGPHPGLPLSGFLGQVARDEFTRAL